MTRSSFDRLLGFLSGIIAMSVVVLVVGITYLEANGLNAMTFGLAIAALLTLLLLRGVPIDEINFKDVLTVKFEIRDQDDRE